MSQENKTTYFIQVIKIMGVLLGIFGSLVIADDYINKKISEQLESTKYIEEISKNLRPFLIFNRNSNIIYDHGGLNYINKVEVDFPPENLLLKNPIIIKITPNNFLQVAPLLECLSPIEYIETVERFDNTQWIYKLKVTAYINDLEQVLFKMEILK